MDRIIETDESKWINRSMDPRLHGSSSRVPFSQGDSPSRRDMVASQLSQVLATFGNTFPRIMGGQEKELATYTHRVVVPFECVVKNIIRTHPKTHNGFESDIILIIESMDSFGYFDVIEVPYSHCMDSQFGYRYIKTELMKKIRVNDILNKGDLLAHSPNVDPDSGLYKSGTGLNVALMGSLCGVEDGACIAEDLKPILSTVCIKKVTIPFGTHSIPINLFGNHETYKPFMDVGDYIGDDGILAVTRKTDSLSDAQNPNQRRPSLLGMSLLDATSLMEIDTSDTTWVGAPNARIIKMDVIRTYPKNSNMLTETEEQLAQYADQKLMYYQQLVRAYATIKDPINGYVDARLSPRLSTMLERAGSMIAHCTPKSPVKLMRGHEPVDEWEVTITFEYELNSAEGSKYTDANGGKVIGVTFLPRSAMPYDPVNKVHADMVMLDQATGNRTNPGRDIYMAVTAAGHRLKNEINAMADEIGICDEYYERAYDRIIELYECVDPRYANDVFTVHTTQAKRNAHVDKYARHGLYMATYYDLKMSNTDRLLRLREKFNIRGERVQFVNYNGELETTEEEVLIAELHMYTLEKAADKSTAVSSPEMQHFGIPANPNTLQKKTSLYPEYATRFFGEAEANATVSITPKGTLSEIYDRGFNPTAHVEMMYSIMMAENPMDIDCAVDRDMIPIAGGRPLATSAHMLKISGKNITFKKINGHNQHYAGLVKRNDG